MNESVVSVKNLSHRYAVQWAVKDINFELPSGGVYGLLGANGAGKSTIMNIICGVVRQTIGEVLINGIDLAKFPTEANRFIGFLPQTAPVIPELNVEEYLSYAARLRHVPQNKVKSAVNEVMEKVQITHFRKRLIGNLSGGFQQRVGIAQAVVHSPKLVVLDEPTNGLDPNQITEVRYLIKEIAAERTVILSTHILQEVQAVCDQIWMINQGSVVFSGGIADFDNYIVPNTITVAFRTPISVDSLLNLSAITQAEFLGGQRFRVHYNDFDEAADQLVHASITNGWHLKELIPERASLDVVFSELSKTSNP